MAIEAQGTRFFLSTSTALSTSATALLGEVNSISGPAQANSEIDISHLLSTAKEFLPGLLDNGSITIEANFLPSDVGQVNFRTVQRTRALRKWVIAFNDSASSIITGDGYAVAYTPSAAVDDKVTVSMGVRITGGVTYTTN